MKNTHPLIDDYIATAPAYAQPILTKLRTLFHKAHPDIVESMKWSSPHFEHKGILGGMGAFKTHVSYGFWRAKAMKDPAGLFEGDEKQSPFAVKAMSLEDLPSDKVLISYIKEAVALNDAGDKTGPGSGKGKTQKPAPRPPKDLVAALKKNKKAKATFDGFSPSHKREYIEWLIEAKREATRVKRLATSHRMDGRRQAAQLEVHEEVAGRPRPPPLTEREVSTMRRANDADLKSTRATPAFDALFQSATRRR